MRRALKWIFRIFLGLVGLIVIALTFFYFIIGSDLSRTFDAQVAAVEIPNDAASVADGARLAKLRGCNGGCHSAGSEGADGQVFFEMFDGTKVVASDLASIARDWSVEDIDRAVRHGVQPDGTSAIAIMPSEMLSGLSDEDFAQIVAYLRSLEPREEPLPKTSVGPLIRMALWVLERDYGSFLAAEQVADTTNNVVAPEDDSLHQGWYLATTVCTECHAPDLNGIPRDAIPPLSTVVAYTPDEFTLLMREGVPVGGREFDLMKTVAVGRFSHFTDAEIMALYRYLRFFGTGAAYSAEEQVEIEAIREQILEIARVTSGQEAGVDVTSAYLGYFSREPVLRLPDGAEIAGREAIDNFYRTAFDGFQMISNTYRDPGIEVRGSTATRTYIGEAVGIPPGADEPVTYRNRYYDELVKEDGEWKMQLHSFTPVGDN